MTSSTFRRRVGENTYVAAVRLPDGGWRVEVVDAMSRAVADDAERTRALEEVLEELSSLRGHIWRVELGRQLGRARDDGEG